MSFYQNVGIDFRQLASPTTSSSASSTPAFSVLNQNITGAAETITSGALVTSMSTVIVLKVTAASTIYLPYTAIPPYTSVGTVSSIPTNALVGIILHNDSTYNANIYTLAGLSAYNRTGTGLLTISIKNKVYWFYHTGNNYWSYFS